jgi:FAD:protein FMN transferase
MLLENKLAAQTTHCAMGTVMTHKAFGVFAEDSLEMVQREIAWLEGLFSRFLPDSEISRINRSAGIQRERVSPETFELLSNALEFSRDFPGTFDVTIAPVVRLWHEARKTLAQPDETSLRRALALVNDRDLILDPQEMTAGLRNVGQSIDLGGIAKGFAGDRILEVFKEFGVCSAYSNLGGNVVTLGAKPDGSPWRIGIQHPRQENRIIGSVSVVSQSVVTSGDYQRFYTDRRGIRRHHILDPRSGYPAEAGWISVSVVCERSLTADALSTLLFVAGREKALEFLADLPQTEAIFVDPDLRVYVTAGLRTRFQADQGIEVKILD